MTSSARVDAATSFARVDAATLSVRVDPATRVHAGPRGGLCVGGSPLRVLKLDRPAMDALLRWRSGDGTVLPSEQQLACRLHDHGIAVLTATATALSPDDVTVVVPAYGRVGQLDRCLARIGRCAQVLVVDDASPDAGAVADVATRHGARLLRRQSNGGPAAARNDGLARVDTELVAFVDSDVELPDGWLDALLRSLRPGVAAVGPRVVGAGGPGLLARYEAGAGPLDLGRTAGPVRPGARVPYLPAAVLVCRTAPLGTGFDERLRVAEDVDLLWRLHADGQCVRYAPDVVVTHTTRTGAVDWLRQRHSYGRGAAELDLRHPGAVAPAVVSRWALPALGALLLGRPEVALVATGVTAAVLHGKLPAATGRLRESVRLSVAGTGWALVGLCEAAARPWLPGLLPAAVVSRSARRLLVVAVATRHVRARRAQPPGLAPLPWSALRLLEDLAYGTGVWHGAVQRRRVGVLLPRVA